MSDEDEFTPAMVKGGIEPQPGIASTPTPATAAQWAAVHFPAGTLPPIVEQQLKSFDDAQVASFTRLFQQQAKSSGSMIALAILFPIQLILLKKVGLWVAFLLTGGGFGIWYFVEWFMTPRRVRAFNEQVAMDVALQVKQMGT